MLRLAGQEATDGRAPHFAMTPAGPVDQQHGLVGCVVEVADNLLDEDMDEPLIGTEIPEFRLAPKTAGVRWKVGLQNRPGWVNRLQAVRSLGRQTRR